MPEGRGRLVLGVVSAFAVLYLIGLFVGEEPEPVVTVAGQTELAPTTVVPTTLPAPVAVTATRATVSLPAALSRIAATTDGSGAVLLAGGRNAQRASVAQVLRFEPATGAFTPTGALAEAVQKAMAVPGASGPLVLGGIGTDKPTAAVQALAVPKATIAGRLPEPRTDAAAAVIGSTIYVVGGFDGGREPTTVLASSDGGATFRTVGSLLNGNRNGALVAVGESLYLIGGEENGKQVAKVLRIDPTDGSSAQVGLLPAPVSQAAAFVLEGSVFLAGGRLGPNPTDQVLRLDLDSGTATLAGTLPEAVAHPAVAVVGDVAWLLGGEAAAPSAAVVEVRATR
jgi:hypothetical protein